MSTRSGPFEELDWPDHLTAMVVESTPRPRLHGYDIEQDLARHYTLAESMFIALVGRAPTRGQGRAFEIALMFASACPVNEAPTHTAILARSIGAPVSSALGAGLLVVCEATRAEVTRQADLLHWLEHIDERAQPGTPPACAREADDRDAEAVAQIRELLDHVDTQDMIPPHGLSRTAAVLTVMWRCGLRSPDQLIVALCWSKTISVGAEALAAKRGGMINFPARLPNFRYEARQR